jgi:hypothetical protein
MPRPSEREIDESYDRAGYGYDPEDEALLMHVLGDDEPPQGLHQHGFKRTEEDFWIEHEYFYDED